MSVAEYCLQLRDALVDCYSGELQPNRVAGKYPRVSRQAVENRLTNMPKGLQCNTTSKTLIRVANELSGHVEKGCYTEAELRAAVAEYASRRKNVKAIVAKYGVSAQTLRRRRQVVDAAVGSSPAASTAHRAVSSMEKRVGRSHSSSYVYKTSLTYLLW